MPGTKSPNATADRRSRPDEHRQGVQAAGPDLQDRHADDLGRARRRPVPDLRRVLRRRHRQQGVRPGDDAGDRLQLVARHVPVRGLPAEVLGHRQGAAQRAFRVCVCARPSSDGLLMRMALRRERRAAALLRKTTNGGGLNLGAAPSVNWDQATATIEVGHQDRGARGPCRHRHDHERDDRPVQRRLRDGDAGGHPGAAALGRHGPPAERPRARRPPAAERHPRPPRHHRRRDAQHGGGGRDALPVGHLGRPCPPDLPSRRGGGWGIPSTAYSFAAKPEAVDRWQEDDPPVEYTRAWECLDEKVTAPDMGYEIASVLS